MKINMPEQAKEIIEKLQAKGFEAYAVGGCVRDALLGKEPNDWDITTSAKPEEILEIFKDYRTIPTGIKHGTITVLADKTPFEVTTYRIDGDYSDGRRPDNVIFTNDLKEDLRRRDFTINAMAYSDSAGLVDYFDGKSDIKNKIIRCVGSAEERFSEDYLRMMRAYRFSAVLGFSLDDELIKAVQKSKFKINDIAVERIRVEFDKLIVSNNFSEIRQFFDMFDEVLFPEINRLRTVMQKNKYHNETVFEHTMKVFENIENSGVMRLSALFHDTGKYSTLTTDDNGTTHFYGHSSISAEITEEILKRMKYDNETIRSVCLIVKEHKSYDNPSVKYIKKIISKFGVAATKQFIDFYRADLCGKSEYAKQKFFPVADEYEKIYNEIVLSGEPLSTKDLKINGKDIINALNISPSEKIGKILDYLLEIVLDNPDLNTKKQLIDIVLTKSDEF